MQKTISLLTPALVSLVLLFTGVQNSFAQEQAFTYAYNPDGKAVELSSKNSKRFKQKHAVITAIFNDLIEAKGARNMPEPELVMNNAEQRPAWIDLKSNTLVIEEKAYGICKSLGKDSSAAIALLIAHELIHYYEKHDWQEHFLQNYSQNLDESQGKLMDNHLELEIEADCLGGFLANMAGYNTSGLSERLLPLIYESYDIKVTDPEGKYPSLEERINIALKSEESLEQMNALFDMSNYLTAIGEYDLAHRYLQRITHEFGFQSRELFNNQAVLLTLSALSMYSPTEMPFILPLELDLNSRLSRKGGEKETREQLLLMAEENVNRALTLDKAYFPAFNNHAAIKILQGDYFEAEYSCQRLLRLKKKADKLSIARAHINLGIIDQLENNQVGARAHFEKAAETDLLDLAMYNIAILDGEQPRIQSTKTAEFSMQIDGVDLHKFFAKIMRDEESPKFSQQLDEQIGFHMIEKPESQILINLVDWGDKGFHFFQRGNSLQIQEKKIKLGSNISDLEKLIGPAKHHVMSPTGALLVYGNKRLLAEINIDKKITRFILVETAHR